MKHVICLSGGKDSTAMALRLMETEPRDYEFIVTPTGDELPEMKPHWEKLARLFGKPLTFISPGFTLVDLTKKMNMLPNFRARFCTRLLKIIPYQNWLINHLPAVSYVGLRADEEGRTGMESCDMNLFFETRYPLREYGWKIGDVICALKRYDVKIPARTDCARCFYQRTHEWWVLWKTRPEIYASAIDDEDRTKHTYRTPNNGKWPASLRELAKAFEERGEPAEHKRETECRVCNM